MKIFYFTATGNSLCVAKRLGGELLSIPRVLKEDKRYFKDDKIGVVFPCYYFGVPKSVESFLREAVLEAPYTFAIMTYGNMDGGGLRRFRSLAREVETRFDFTAKIKMVDNYLPMFDIADQLAKETSKEIEAQLALIAERVTKAQRIHAPNPFASRITTFFSSVTYHRAAKKAPGKFQINQDCNGCGICASVCPRSNIVVEKAPRYLSDCEICYACIHNCPRGAIHLKAEKSAVRFRNREVSLKEIISANN
ncbi:EFR1 family ferrodoxin [Myxococcota bacterium]|nr:EFR1 family ferrodoxin [Myxococcota bacterium]MBU1534528.1 EFR1 family ferrodoxin [Myxococcota bacterium]